MKLSLPNLFASFIGGYLYAGENDPPVSQGFEKPGPSVVKSDIFIG